MKNSKVKLKSIDILITYSLTFENNCSKTTIILIEPFLIDLKPESKPTRTSASPPPMSSNHVQQAASIINAQAAKLNGGKQPGNCFHNLYILLDIT